MTKESSSLRVIQIPIALHAKGGDSTCDYGRGRSAVAFTILSDLLTQGWTIVSDQMTAPVMGNGEFSYQWHILLLAAPAAPQNPTLAEYTQQQAEIDATLATN